MVLPSFLYPEGRQGNRHRPARATDMTATSKSRVSAPQLELMKAWSEYLVDSVQRSVLFWDVMRKRGNIFLENVAKGEPPVLIFGYDVLIDGRKLDRPCNYALMHIRPPEGLAIDSTKRPVVVVDPRAGQGRWVQARFRDRLRPPRRPPGLLHRVLPGAGPGPDPGGHRGSRGAVPRGGHPPAPRGWQQALRHRQLPGRLGGGGAGRGPARADRPRRVRRRAPIVLGGRR